MKGKKILAASLSVAMVFSLNTISFADENESAATETENAGIVNEDAVVDEIENGEKQNSEEVNKEDADDKEDAAVTEEKASEVKEGANAAIEKAITGITITSQSGEAKSYESIADAFAALNDGDTLTIPAGAYSPSANEQLRVEADNVIIQGVGAETILDCGTFTCSGQAGLLVVGDNVTVKDLTVKSNASVGSMGTIKWTGMTGLAKGGLLENVTIANSGQGYGLNIHGVDGLTVRNVKITDTQKSAVGIANAINTTITGLTTCESDSLFYRQDVTFNYKDSDDYKNECDVDFVDCNFHYNKISFERAADAKAVTVNDKELVKVMDSNTASFVTEDNSSVKNAASVVTDKDGYKTAYTSRVDFEDVASSIKDGDTLTLQKDLEIDKIIWITEKEGIADTRLIDIVASDFTFDLNGHTITGSKDFIGDQNQTNEKYLWNLVNVGAYGGSDAPKNITIKNGTLKAGALNRNVLNITDGSEVTLTDIVLDHSNADKGGAPLINNASDITVNGSLKTVTGDKSWYAIGIDDKNGDATLEFTKEADLIAEGEGSLSDYISGAKDNIVGGEYVGIINGRVDNTAPEWNYGNIIYDHDVQLSDKAITNEELVKQIMSNDKEWATDKNGIDHYAFDQWQFENNFDITKKGTYKLDLYAYDKAGNKSYNVGITINVVDTTAPTINWDNIDADEYTYTMEVRNEQMSGEDLAKAVKEDGREDWAYDVSGWQFVFDKWYDENTEGAGFDATKVGSYKVNFFLDDYSGNRGDAITITVKVVDTQKPTIDYGAVDYHQTYELSQTPLTGEKAAELFTKSEWVKDNYGEGHFVVDQWVFDNGIDQWKAFDGTTVGEYMIRFIAVDEVGNTGETVDIYVNVVDTTKPTIKIEADWKNYVELGSEFTNYAATAEDAAGIAEEPKVDRIFYSATYDGLKDNYEIVDKVDTDKLGWYKLRYAAKDINGNVGYATVCVCVEDTTAPVIKLNGDKEQNFERCEGTYTEEGALVKDLSLENGEKIVEPSVINYYVEGQLVEDHCDGVDINRAGMYKISYVFTDDSGNKSKTVTRIVNVVDTKAPVITLNGDRVITIERAVDEYIEEGAVSQDGTDTPEAINEPTRIHYYENEADKTPEKVTEVDENRVGMYKLAYESTDDFGHEGFKVRVVNVVDTKAPLLTLNGESKVTIDKGGEYIDEGAVATDDGNIVTELTPVKINYSVDGKFVATVDKVDTSKVGTYKIVYEYTDPYGNEAVDANKPNHNYIMRTVEVVETEGTATLIVNYTTKDGKVVATEEFTETAQKGEFTWVFGENYKINPPEGYNVTGYEGINKEMTVEIAAGETTVTEGKAIVEPIKVADTDKGETTPPAKEEPKKEAPAKTSDPMTLGLLLAAMGASGAGIAGLRRKNK